MRFGNLVEPLTMVTMVAPRRVAPLPPPLVYNFSGRVGFHATSSCICSSLSWELSNHQAFASHCLGSLILEMGAPAFSG